jgi:aerobic-type carbon monoxide dehydrogenase small subunit (CoxS/CutS family)
MSLKVYLEANPDAGEAELREALSGNICRCTGYQPIIAAALAAAERMRAGRAG